MKRGTVAGKIGTETYPPIREGLDAIKSRFSVRIKAEEGPGVAAPKGLVLESAVAWFLTRSDEVQDAVVREGRRICLAMEADESRPRPLVRGMYGTGEPVGIVDKKEEPAEKPAPKKKSVSKRPNAGRGGKSGHGHIASALDPRDDASPVIECRPAWAVGKLKLN